MTISITDPSVEVQPALGDFGLVSDIPESASWTTKIVERAISWGTDSPYFHAFVYVGDGKIVEAMSKVRVSPVTSRHDITWSTGRLAPEHTPSQVQREAIARAAMSYVGQSYNKLDILAIALAQPRLGRTVDGDEWWVRRLSDDHMQICSQLVINAYRMASIDLYPGKLAGLVSPGDLGKLLRS